MSDYGPALFISRKDGKDIPKSEQGDLQTHVTNYARELQIKSAIENEDVDPSFYDYDGYEKKAVSFLMYSSPLWSTMPEEIQKDHEKMDEDDILKIGENIEKNFPGIYEFKCYYVEA